MATTVYLSRSYRGQDDDLVTAIQEVLEQLEHRGGYDLSVIDSDYADAEQLAEHIEGDIDRSDLVAVLFSRRHHVDVEVGEDGEADYWTPPAYLVSEAGYARAQGKRIVVFLEENIPSHEMGLVDAYNPQRVDFSHDEVDTVQFRRRAREALRAQISEHEQEIDPLLDFSVYETQHTVFPNGYVHNRYNITVEARRPEPITHEFYVDPEPGAELELPNGEALLEQVSDETPLPYPREPFVSFVSENGDLEFVPLPEEEPYKRRYRVRTPEAGETYSYQWMYGTTGAFSPDREIESNLLTLHKRAVRRVEYNLRRHTLLGDRISPKIATIPPDRPFEAGRNDDVLRPYYERAEIEPVERTSTPLFDVYRFIVTPVPAATDLLIMF